MFELYQAQPFYFSIAIGGTALFLVKTILLLVGSDADSGNAGDGFDVSFDGDAESHLTGSEAFEILSVQSVLAFCMGVGWMGLACSEEWSLAKSHSAIVAVVFGFAMMLLNAWLMTKIKGLNSAGSNDMMNAIGLRGRTYTQIPEKGQGMGQVELTVNGKQQILNAFSENGPITSFSTVYVTDVDESGNLIVRAE